MPSLDTPIKDVKVFISSTFTDLDKERNYISQVVFNSLRELYKGLSINEIDLRWGITEEQANNGRVLDLCLQYIHESKPFFIGILGDRYGTIFPSQQNILSPLVEEYFPKAVDDIQNEISATEVEILNGVIRNPNARAIFFLKKDSKPYLGESKSQWVKLEKLKHRVRTSGHKVIEYSSLEDFDVIKEFIKEHIGDPEKYNIPAEGMERADKISRLHYERSLSYVHEVPYDSKLDNLLNKIDYTVAQSKKVSAFIGLSGVGKSTTLAYMAHHFSGDRIYVPIYCDIDDLPSTPDEVSVFLFHALKNAIFRHRRRKSKWYRFKEWFRDGLKEIDFNNSEDLYKELLRHQWCFVLDNYESAEWLPFSDFGRVSFNKAKQVYDKIAFFFCQIGQKYKSSFDIKLMIVRDVDKDYFDKYVVWNNSEPVFDLNMNWWFEVSEYLDHVMKNHCKNLSQSQYNGLLNAPGNWIPGRMRMVWQYMIDYVRHDEINEVIKELLENQRIDYPHRLYLNKVTSIFGKETAVKAIELLIIFRTGLSLQEFEEHMQLSHVNFLFLMRLLSTFVVYTGNGVRLKDHIIEYTLKDILGITDAMIRNHASRLSDQYEKELFGDFSFEHFKYLTDNRLRQVVEFYDSVMPPHVRYQFLIQGNTRPSTRSLWKFKERRILTEKEKLGFRLYYWFGTGRLTEKLIREAYQNLKASGITEWVMDEAVMRNYLLSAYAARRKDRLMKVVHNPYFIKKLWHFPLFLFVWDTYLNENGDFSAPRSKSFNRDSYDMKSLMRIVEMLQVTFHVKVFEPFFRCMKPGESFDVADIYLKNYPKN